METEREKEIERDREGQRKRRAKQREEREYKKDGDQQSFKIAHSSLGKCFFLGSFLSEMIEPIEFASYILVMSVYIFVYSVFKVHYQTIKYIRAIIIDFFNGMRLIKL